MMHCTACGKRFGGITAFDIHRVGKYPLCDHNHKVPVGVTARKYRRCLSADEMREKGLFQNSRGEWSCPYSNARTLALPTAKKRIVARVDQQKERMVA